MSITLLVQMQYRKKGYFGTNDELDSKQNIAEEAEMLHERNIVLCLQEIMSLISWMHDLDPKRIVEFEICEVVVNSW